MFLRHRNGYYIHCKTLTLVTHFCGRFITCFNSPCWNTDGDYKQWSDVRLYLGYCWWLCNTWPPFGGEHVHCLRNNDTHSSYLFYIGSQAWSLCQDSPTSDVQSADAGHTDVCDHGNTNLHVVADLDTFGNGLA